MFPAAIFLGVQFLFCALVAMMFGFYEPPPVRKYAKISFSLVLLVVGVRALWNLRSRPEKPTRHIIALDWSAQRGFAVAMIFVWLQFVALTWGKAMLPVATTMWADAPLANFEAALFGQDLWRLFPSSNRIMDAIYMAWLPTVGMAFTILYFSKRPNRSQAILALFLTIGVLGTIGQYALPSGGPIFFERLGFGDRFSEIPYAWQTNVAAEKLWSAFEGRYISFATGISAFPSIHVAVSTWMVITFRNPLAAAYAVFIFIGSVALGWHYALDGIAGAIGAGFCYLAAKPMLQAKASTPLLGFRRPLLSALVQRSDARP